MNRLRRRTICLLTLFFLCSANIFAQDMTVPVDVQVPLLLKILTFDRNLAIRAGDEIVIGVLYQKKFRDSQNLKEEIIKVIESSPVTAVNDLRVRCVAVEFEGLDALDRIITEEKIDILYVTPLRTVGMGSVTGVSRRLGVTTVTGVEDYVKQGVSIGFGLKGKRPRIIINLPASKAEGADFNAQLLKLASVLE